MQTCREEIQDAAKTIKQNLVDIAHASHHIDFLNKAEASGRLPGGMNEGPKMMLWNADEETAQEWRDQIKTNTLGFMGIAKRHHKKTIKKSTEAIAETQEAAIKKIADADLNDRQKRAIKLTYDQLIKSATEEAHKVKRERDEASKGKLEERPAKRQRIESQRYETNHTHTLRLTLSTHPTYSYSRQYRGPPHRQRRNSEGRPGAKTRSPHQKKE